MSKAKLLPEIMRCPYCKKVVYLYTSSWFNSYVYCAFGKCDARGPVRRTARGAINAWNKVAVK
jgi:hypothetical protein